MDCCVNSQDWKERVGHIHAEMAVHVQPFLASISKTDDGESGRACGTGVYLELQECPFLLTCEHVARWQGKNGYRLAHLLVPNGLYHAFSNPFLADRLVDLALTHIASTIWSEGEKRSFQIDAFWFLVA
jgi:hypothetical protein